MKKITNITYATLFLIIALLLITTVIQAQGGSEYDLSWSTINAGGTSSGGEFSLTGIIGQQDAGILVGDTYSLNGGFLFNMETEQGSDKIYLPLILK